MKVLHALDIRRMLHLTCLGAHRIIPVGALLLCTVAARGQTPPGRPSLPSSQEETTETESASSTTPADETESPAKPGETVRPLPKRVYTSRTMGLNALSDMIYTQAEHFFIEYREQTRGHEPEFADATVLLARAYIKQGAPDLALETITHHEKNSPGLTDKHYLDALRYWRAAALAEKGNLEQAIECVKPLAGTSASPGFRSLALQLLGDANSRLKHWDTAEGYFQTLLQDFAKTDHALETRIALAKINLAKNQPGKAADILEKAQKTHRDIPEVTFTVLKVIILVQQEKLTEALELYLTISDRRPSRPDPDWWTAASLLAEHLTDAERYEKALRILPHARILAGSKKEKIRIALKTVTAFVELKKVDSAISSLEVFKKQFPDSEEFVPVQLKLAELLRSTGKHMLASGYFDQLIQDSKAPSGMRYRAAISRGWTLREAEQYETAREVFSVASQLGSSSEEKARGAFLAGDTAEQMGHHTTAGKIFRDLADNFPESSFAGEARFRQARASVKSKLFAEAADVYAQFINAFPENNQIADARLERGIALRNGGNFPEATRVLMNFAETYAGDDRVPRALMEAQAAALAGDDIPTAIRALNSIIEDYDQSSLYPHAIYRRAHVNFFRASYPEALRDSKLFLEKFSKLPLAADVLVWLGDYYANMGEFSKSQDYFTELVETHPDSVLAPSARYEAAKCAYYAGDLREAENFLRKLEETCPEDRSKVLAQGHMLYGDILTKTGTYEGASDHFAKARELAGDSIVGLAALGRRAEMHYSMAGDDKASLTKARECFQSIIANPVTPPELKEMATYRLGKCYEKLEETDTAVDTYLSIVYRYDNQLSDGLTRDWFYFARSGYDAARLLMIQGRFRIAARVYERLAQSGIPTAGDARQKAREIRKMHGLDE